ncbi:NADPH dehydrogenase NamA [Paenibacillus chartarius]|uniref:NADPH dehydrogenase NamA n=1 Tax=Paenibacillus chartarius TaxID=747481 RepID=A0ABV6DTF6_9BACL
MRALLFTPITFRELTLKNRIVMSPMNMYASDESGAANDWHKLHYASRAVGQTGLIIVEATAVAPEGRVTKRDLGIWEEGHIEAFRQVTEAVRAQGAAIGIQLAHAGRKANVDLPLAAPSAIPFSDESKVPEALSEPDIRRLAGIYGAAARRARLAGFDVIEIHAAHGYLIHEFLSPVSNKREDAYGGSRDGRFRFLGEVVEAIRAEWSGPLFVRISANEYHPEGNTLDDYTYYAARLRAAGVDLIDVSTGGLIPFVPEVYPGYQVPYADHIRREAGIPAGAVGLITEPEQAQRIMEETHVDLILIGRELLRDPYWPRRAARRLGAELKAPASYQRAWEV